VTTSMTAITTPITTPETTVLDKLAITCVFYDGACPLCSREVKLYKKLAEYDKARGDNEDSEMVVATIQTAAGEVQRAVQEIAKERLKPEYNNVEIQERLAEKQSDLAKAKSYLDEAAVVLQKIQLIQNYMAKSQQYEVLSKQMLEIAMLELNNFVNSNPSIMKMQQQTAEAKK